MVDRVFPKNISITHEKTTDSTEVLADPREVEQIFLNFLINSRDAMPQGGEIRIHLSEHRRSEDGSDRNYLRITVADSGPGIPAETADKIFQAYFSTKASSGGTGLGLATVHRLTRGLGGEVTLDTEVENGATFHVDLPKHEDNVGDTVMMDLPTNQA